MQKFLNLSSSAKYALVAAAVVAIFGLAARTLPQNLTQRDPVYGYSSDSDNYWDLAGNLLSRHAYVNSPDFGFAFLGPVNKYTFATQRLPGYPVFLAVLRALSGGGNPQSVLFLLAGAVMVYANAFFIFSVLERDILKRPPAAWMYWPVIFYLPYLFYSNGINSDFLTAVLLSGFCYFYLTTSRSRFWALPLGAAAVLTRANALLFVLPFVFIMAAINFRQKRELLFAVFTLLFLLAAVGGWSYRNYRLSGYFKLAPFTGLSLQQNYLLKMDGIGETAKWNSPSWRQNYFYELAEKEGYYAAESQIDSEISRDTAKALMSHPFQGLKAYTSSVARFFLNEYFIWEPYRQQASAAARFLIFPAAFVFYFLPALAFGFSLVYHLAKKSKTVLAVLIYAAAVYAAGTTAILGIFARYSLPIGFVMLFAVMDVILIARKRGLGYNSGIKKLYL